MDNLNKILKHIRVFNNLTQLEAQEKLGITRAYISEIERGNKTPSMEVLWKYAEVFKIPLSTIMLYAENYKNKTGIKNKFKELLTKKSIQFLDWIVER